MSKADEVYRYCNVVGKNIQVKRTFFEGNEKYECMGCDVCENGACKNERLCPENKSIRENNGF